MSETVDLTPNWDGLRKWLHRVHATDPVLAHEMNNTLGSEKAILCSDDIPPELVKKFREFPAHGHWHDLADLAHSSGYEDKADEYATVWARVALGINVDIDPIKFSDAEDYPDSEDPRR